MEKNEIIKISSSQHSPRLRSRYEKYLVSLDSDELLTRGDVPDSSRVCLGIVGSRKATPYGLRFVRELLSAIARRGLDWTIISGGALGIDIEAHEAALRLGMGTQAWLVGPLHSPSPQAHWDLFRVMTQRKGSGLIVPSCLDPESRGFPSTPKDWVVRNFWMACSCDALIAVESSEKSGTWHSVKYAGLIGIPTFALPGPIYSRQSEGTNQMISAGCAYPILSVELLVEQLVVELSRLPYNKK